MESLCELAMVNAVREHQIKDVLASRSFQCLTSKMIEYLIHLGLGFILDHVRAEDFVKSLVSYWNLYRKWETLIPITEAESEERTKDFIEDDLLHFVKTFCLESHKEVEDFIDRIDDLTYLILGRRLSSEELFTERQKYTVLSFLGIIIPEMKYSVNLIFADFFGTQVPDKTQFCLGYRIFPRCVVIHLKRRVRASFSRVVVRIKDGTLFYTLFQGLKKGFLPLRPDAIAKSLVKHKQTLSQPSEVDKPLLKRLKRILRSEFSELPTFVADNFHLKDKLSVRATIESPLSQRGQVGWAERQWLEDHDDEFYYSYFDRDSLIDPLPFAPEFVGFLVEGADFKSLKSVYVNRPVCTNYQIRKIIDQHQKQNRVQPAIILEPMKARIITKPSVGLYSGMHSIQESMWAWLKRFREFELIGRPVSCDDIDYIGRSWQAGMKFNSGDYSAATDNLKSYISEEILKFILSELSERDDLKEVCERAINSFVRSEISYVPDQDFSSKKGGFYKYFDPSTCGHIEEVVQQQCGQLMGHILSFPVLCIANYCSFRMSVSKRPVLINGDDILFCCNSREYDSWSTMSKRFGFEPSVGKNLFSDRICQINSVLFRVNTVNYGLDALAPQFIYVNSTVIPYVNFGIMTGRKKGTRVEKCNEIDAIPQKVVDRFPVLPDLLKYSCYSIRQDWRTRVYELFIKNNSELKEMKKILPEGGLLDRQIWSGPHLYRGSKESKSPEFQALGQALFSMRGPASSGLDLRKLKRICRYLKQFPFGCFDLFEKEEEVPVRLLGLSYYEATPCSDIGAAVLEEVKIEEDV
jgi:hypothetical protein